MATVGSFWRFWGRISSRPVSYLLWLPAVLGVPWLTGAAFQSLLLSSLGVFLVSSPPLMRTPVIEFKANSNPEWPQLNCLINFTKTLFPSKVTFWVSEQTWIWGSQKMADSTGLNVAVYHQFCPALLWPTWTIAHQAPLSMGFSRQGYWNGLPFSSQGDLPNPGRETVSCIGRWILYHWASL